MENLRKTLIAGAKKLIGANDPSHDFDHAYRVLTNAEYLAKYEGGSLEIIIPAALFHDVVNHPKNHPRARSAAKESAQVALDVLKNFNDYDHENIAAVQRAIIEHSYSNGLRPSSLESKIIQDADRLEATGAIAIMRTFSSSGQMKRKFYDSDDPFCQQHEPSINAIDLFYSRLLHIKGIMNTATAKKMAEMRTRFLYAFLEQLKEELCLASPSRFS